MNRRTFITGTLATGMAMGIGNLAQAKPSQGKVMKIGIIGLDTSHAPAFVKALNGPNPRPEYKGFRIVAAYPQGSKTIKSSMDRVEGYIKQVKEYGVEIVGSIAELTKKVDAIMLESNDGNVHLEQAREVFSSGKPMFIDKPIAASLKDAITLFKEAKENNVPIFSASSLRYIENALEARNGSLVGAVLGAETYSPAVYDSTHPDLMWYGIHGVEMLFTVMGTGCQSVTRVYSEGADVVVGRWGGDRLGVFRGTRKGKHLYGGTVFGENNTVNLGKYAGYDPLLKQILDFFVSKNPPIPEEETLEMFAFMEAAQESKNRNGAAVSLKEMFEKSR